jgi:putative transposase
LDRSSEQTTSKQYRPHSACAYGDPAMNIPLIRLAKGDAVVLDGVWYQEKLRTTSTLTLRQIGGDAARTFNADELTELYFSERLKIVRASVAQLDPIVRELIERPFESFSQDQQAEMLKRLDYVTACDRFFARGLYVKRAESGYKSIALVVARFRRQVLAKQQARRSVEAPLERVSGSTLRDWYTRWREAGRLLGALAPRTDKKGSRKPRLDPAVRAIIADFIRGKWLTLEKPPLSIIYDGICGLVEKLRLPVPSKMAVRRWIKANIDPYTQALYREGRKQADHDFRLTKRAPAATRPLEIVEFDETPLDIILVDQNGKPRGRAYLTVGICLATGMIVGWHIGWERPSWSTVMQALRMAVLKKDLGDCGADSPYPVFGVPEIIKVDNGPAYRSTSLVAAGGQLQFEVRLVPRGKPHLKGKIERFFGEVARDFLSVFPGRTFANTLERLDYDSEGNARMTLEHCRRLFMRWVVDIYHNRPNTRTFNQTPLERWEALAGYGVRLPPQAADLAPLIGLVVNRTIQAEGITFMGLTYRDDALKLLRKSNHLGREWMVKVDPLDISELLVLDDQKNRWIRVACQQPELVDGLTLKMWMDVVSAARARTKAGQRVARKTLLKAREYLLREAAALGHKPRAAPSAQEYRWMVSEIKSPDYEISIDPDDVDEDSSEAPLTPAEAARGRRKHNIGAQQENAPETFDPTLTDPASSAQGHPIADITPYSAISTTEEQAFADEQADFEELERLRAFRTESQALRGTGLSVSDRDAACSDRTGEFSSDRDPQDAVATAPQRTRPSIQEIETSPPTLPSESSVGVSTRTSGTFTDENDDELYG